MLGLIHSLCFVQDRQRDKFAATFGFDDGATLGQVI